MPKSSEREIMKGQYPELQVIIYQFFFKEYNKDPGSLRTCVIRMLYFGGRGRVDGVGSMEVGRREQKERNEGRLWSVCKINKEC